MAAGRYTRNPIVTTDALASHHDACKNCGTTTRGNYCHQCGQPAHVHVPSAREFLHEFLGHYVALEGKLWKSLALLLFKPGFLSREYIEGRRVRYLEPLRLYLTFSIIFFALVKFSGAELFNPDSAVERPAVAISAADGGRDTVYGKATESQAETSEEFRKKLVTGASSLNEGFGARVDRFTRRPAAQQQEAIKRAFFSYAPYAVFALMPVFAAYLKLLYLGSGRRYGEHFLFALHTNAFAFCLMSVLMLVPSSWGFVQFLLFLWLTFYLPTAMRRVYGGGRLVTSLRWLVLMLLHFLSVVLAIVLSAGSALLT